jgi:tetratricopeptide (TPR) repeat protein
MSLDPWGLLGLEPTRDELAIRRAYARRVKDFRPDEDPQGFQALVAAREFALRWRQAPAPEEEEEEEEEDEAPVPAPQEAAAREPEPRGPAFHAQDYMRAPAPPREADAYAAAVAALRALFRDADAFDRAEEWRDLRRRLAALSLSQRAAFRPQIAGAVVANLPPPADLATMRAELAEDRGVSAVVDGLEAEFELSFDQSGLARLVGMPATLRYLDWLEGVRRALPMSRRSEAERRFLLALQAWLGAEGDTSFALSAASRTDGEKVAALFDRLDGSEAQRGREMILERMAWLLPTEVEAAPGDFAAGRGFAANVAFAEAKWAFMSGGAATVRLLGEAKSKSYAAWAEYATGLAAIAARLMAGEPAYRDASGIPLPPPEDRRYTIWGDAKFAEFWVKARETGRWPLAFDWGGFWRPARRAATAAMPGVATLALVGQAGLIGALWGIANGLGGEAAPFIGPALAIVFVAARIAAGFLMRRVAVWGAIRRIRSADAKWVAGSAARARRVALGAWGARYAMALSYLESFALIAFFGAVVAMVDLPPPSPSTAAEHMQWGRYYDTRDPAKALDAYSRAVQAEPLNAAAWAALGKAHLKAEKFSDAVADLSHALQLDPRLQSAWFDRAFAHAHLDQQQAAIDDYTHSLELAPNDDAAFNNRGVAEQALGRSEDAKADYARAISAKPDFALPYRNRGQILYAAKDYQGALADFAAAARNDVSDAWAAVLSGDAHIALKQDGLALADYDEALKRDPNYVLAMRARAYVLRRLHKYQDALASLRTASTIAPEDAKVMSELGEALEDIGDYAGAERAYDGALAQASGAHALMTRGVVRLYLGKFAPAAQDLSASFASEPWAYAYIWGDVAAERAHLERPRIADGLADALKRKGWPGPVIDYMRGRLDEAALLAAAASPDQTCEAHFYIGERRLIESRTADARAELTIAAQTCPEHFIEARAAKAELGRLP